MATLRAVAPRRQANIVLSAFVTGVMLVAWGVLLAVGAPSNLVVFVVMDAVIAVLFLCLVGARSPKLAAFVLRHFARPGERPGDGGDRAIDALAAVFAARYHPSTTFTNETGETASERRPGGRSGPRPSCPGA